MLNDLKFVAGAVAKKDFVPALTYFRIKDGFIQGFNGTLAICTPTDLAVTAIPKAASFVKAVEKLPDDKQVVLNLTAAGRLSVKSGNFRVIIDCLDDEELYPDVKPEGVTTLLAGGLLPVLNKIAPFMGVDASRPWSRGALLRGQSAFATNNIVLVEHWLPVAFPVEVTLPSDAVKEMLRIGIEPVSVQACERSVTFHYADGSWLRTAHATDPWPDLSRVLDNPSEPVPFPAGFFDGVGRLAGFTEKSDRLYLRGGTISTSMHDDDGATVELDDFGGVGCHYLSQTAKLEGVASTIDFTLFPGPCLFFGDMLRGAIIGFRMQEGPL